MVSCERRTIRIWNRLDGKIIRTVELLGDSNLAQLLAILSSDGSTLFVMRFEPNPIARIWQGDMTKPHREIRQLTANPLHHLAFSHDSQRFAFFEKKIHVCSVETGKEEFSLEPKLTVLDSIFLEFSPTGRYLVAARQIWDLETLERVWECPVPSRFVGPINRVQFQKGMWAGDDDHIVISQNGRSTLWNWRENKQLVTFAILPGCNWVSFNHVNGHWKDSPLAGRYVQFLHTNSKGKPRWYNRHEFESELKRTNDPTKVKIQRSQKDTQDRSGNK